MGTVQGRAYGNSAHTNGANKQTAQQPMPYTPTKCYRSMFCPLRTPHAQVKPRVERL